MKRVHGRLCYQLSIELLEDGTFVATGVRGGDSFEGRGNNHTEALKDLANELDEDGIESALEDGTIDDEGDAS